MKYHFNFPSNFNKDFQLFVVYFQGVIKFLQYKVNQAYYKFNFYYQNQHLYSS